MLDFSATFKIELYSLIWGALLVIALARIGRTHSNSVGLPFAFIASYTGSHVGALVHLVNSYDHSMSPYLRGYGYTRETVAVGLEASCLAMISATIGFAMAHKSLLGPQRGSGNVSLPLLHRFSQATLSCGLCALVAITVLARLGIAVPGLQAVLSVLRNFIVVGACSLVLRRYLMGGVGKAMMMAGLLAILAPAAMLVTTAILADSIELALGIMAFFLSLPTTRAKPFWRNFAIFAASTLCAFIFSVAYLQSRDLLRTVVWGGGDISSAIEVVSESAKSFDVGTVAGFEALALIDGRLNQNIFIGLAIEKLQALPDTYENGETIRLALLGWVPRFLWPDKPERGGSEFLEKHTGLKISEGTTFGAGPVFEFYVNFGYIGVALGFLILGFVLRLLDLAAHRALWSGDLGSFAQWYLAGLAMLSALADVFFIVTAVFTALVVGLGLRLLWGHYIGPASPHYPQAKG